MSSLLPLLRLQHLLQLLPQPPRGPRLPLAQAPVPKHQLAQIASMHSWQLSCRRSGPSRGLGPSSPPAKRHWLTQMPGALPAAPPSIVPSGACSGTWRTRAAQRRLQRRGPSSYALSGPCFEASRRRTQVGLGAWPGHPSLC